ncbi:MAG: hypothetical protein IPJ03_15180 [Ignavibacteriales bacterium]|nr:hypothetical protein [Ignavibacteriales bacterium]
MRYIDRSKIQLPPDWETKASLISDSLKECKTIKAKRELIKKNPIWTELRTSLEKVSNGKCWYSEAKEIVSLYDVDHFRPKGKVKKIIGTTSNETGYWWLAYDWKNYRLSGQICNRPLRDTEDNTTKGKHNYFPLRDGSFIARLPEHDINDELVCLLDPTDQDDPSLLQFEKTGDVSPASSKGTWNYSRAHISIKLLHLDFPPLKNARKEVWEYCERKINEAQNLMKDADYKVSITLKTQVKAIFNDLRARANPSSQLSSVAIECILKSNVSWAQKLTSN